MTAAPGSKRQSAAIVPDGRPEVGVTIYLTLASVDRISWAIGGLHFGKADELVLDHGVCFANPLEQALSKCGDDDVGDEVRSTIYEGTRDGGSQPNAL